jgi:hypothetical protein
LDQTVNKRISFSGKEIIEAFSKVLHEGRSDFVPYLIQPLDILTYLEAERVRHAYLRDLFADCDIKHIGFFGFSEVHSLAKSLTPI